MKSIIDRNGIEQLAENVLARGLATVPLTHYTGILLLQGAVHFARRGADQSRRERVRALLLPFARGERDFPSNFPLYNCGGNAAALALRLGWMPEAKEPVGRYAAWLTNRAPRNGGGLVVMPGDSRNGKLWIDAAWAVAPFACHAGVALDDARLIDDGPHQVLGMCRILKDPDCGLLHQCRGFNGPDRLSEDHWSRGNGWAAVALGELVQGLPEGHARRTEVETALVGLLHASLAVQDTDGMWRQEMTDPGAWVETSGTALLLYGLGVALERGLLGDEFRPALERGLHGLLRYIGTDGSIRNACAGCLCPGQGTKADYLSRPHGVNDPHSFGPVLLAFAQGLACGVEELLSVQSDHNKEQKP